jgi:hypothetical protein
MYSQANVMMYLTTREFSYLVANVSLVRMRKVASYTTGKMAARLNSLRLPSSIGPSFCYFDLSTYPSRYQCAFYIAFLLYCGITLWETNVSSRGVSLRYNSGVVYTNVRFLLC